MEGVHICFCGLDGSGKTTQAQYLKEYMLEKGRRCEIVHGFKPGKHAESLKEFAKKNGVLFREAYTDTIRSISYLCDMYETYYSRIEPLLREGYMVISDKFVMDSIVNAPLLGANRDMIHDFASVIPTPELYLYMSLEPQEACVRIEKRNAIESGSRKNKRDFMEKSYLLYEKLEDTYDNVVKIDAAKNEMEIRTEIIKKIEEAKVLRL